MKKKKKLGFALGAGGSRGVAHIGFLRAMEENGIKPDYIAGCSMGSIIGAAYAAGMSVADLERAVYRLRLFDLIAPANRGGLFDLTKARRLIQRYIGDPDFSELKIPFCCIAVDMVSQSVVKFSEGKVLDGVIASSSIPAVFKPMEKDGMRLIDGGVLNRVPYREVREMGADVVVAVDVLGRLDCSEKMPTTLGILLETVDLMDNARTQRKKIEDKNMYNFWLEPDLGKMSQYVIKNISFAVQKGYEIGCKYAERIKKVVNAPIRVRVDRHHDD